MILRFFFNIKCRIKIGLEIFFKVGECKIFGWEDYCLVILNLYENLCFDFYF